MIPIWLLDIKYIERSVTEVQDIWSWRARYWTGLLLCASNILLSLLDLESFVMLLRYIPSWIDYMFMDSEEGSKLFYISINENKEKARCR